MTEDELIELLKPFSANGEKWPSDWIPAMRMVAQKEREACIALCEASKDGEDERDSLLWDRAIELCIKKIRAKNQKQSVDTDAKPEIELAVSNDRILINNVAFEFAADKLRHTHGVPVVQEESPCTPPVDMINSPPHYNQGKIECVDAIRSALTKEEFDGWCKGNAMKYIWRHRYKGKPDEQIGKAVWNLKKMVESDE